MKENVFYHIRDVWPRNKIFREIISPETDINIFKMPNNSKIFFFLQQWTKYKFTVRLEEIFTHQIVVSGNKYLLSHINTIPVHCCCVCLSVQWCTEKSGTDFE